MQRMVTGAEHEKGNRSDVVKPATGASEREGLDGKSVKELREICKSRGINTSTCSDNRDLEDLIINGGESNLSQASKPQSFFQRLRSAFEKNQVDPKEDQPVTGRLLSPQPAKQSTHRDVSASNSANTGIGATALPQERFRDDVRHFCYLHYLPFPLVFTTHVLSRY